MKHPLAPVHPSQGRGLSALGQGIVLAIIVTLFTAAWQTRARAGEAPLRTLVVLPFEIEDTSGESGPADRHDAMLSRMTTLVRDEIAVAQLFHVVPEDLTQQAVAAVHSGTYLRNCNGCEIDIAKRVAARYVLIGWIYKVSTLVLTLHVDIKDATSGKTVYARVFDFRGDNERAYAHAAKTLERSLAHELPTSQAENGARPEVSPLIKIAVFDFELEDTTAAGGTGVSPDESKYLAQATQEAKHKVVESGRYVIVDTAGADLAGAQGHGLRDCGGCDAAIAAKLGADQDMVGVVTKVSMTEYTVTMQVRDARTGGVIGTFATGLRMGADYSWARGAGWLITNRVLASRDKQ